MANPNGNPQNLKSWKPGQSGNPNGRPKRKSFIELLHEHIETQDSELELLKVFHQMLLSSNTYAWKEYLERRDGKVKDELEIDEKQMATFIMRSRTYAESSDDPSSTNGSSN